MIVDSVLTILLSVMATAFASITSISVKNKADNKMTTDDMKAAQEAIQIVRKKLQDGKIDVISLMTDNVSELKGYYVISKNQATRVFSSTLVVCFLGFIIFIVGFIAAAITDQTLAIYTTIAGCVVEVIAGLFFWLYKNAAEQLSLYHERLGRTEKYLTAIQLVEKMSSEKKDETYRYIIETILATNNLDIPPDKSSQK